MHLVCDNLIVYYSLDSVLVIWDVIWIMFLKIQ